MRSIPNPVHTHHQGAPAHHPENKMPILGRDLAKDTEILLDSSLAIVGRPGSGATLTAIRMATAYLSSGHSVLFLDRTGDLRKHHAALGQPLTEPTASLRPEDPSPARPISAALDRLTAAPSHEYLDLQGASLDDMDHVSRDVSHWLCLNYRSGIRPRHRIMLVMDHFSPEMTPDFLHIMELARDYFHLVLTMTDTDWLAPENIIIRSNMRQRLFLSTSQPLLNAEIGNFVSFSGGQTTKTSPANIDLKEGTGWCSGSFGHSVICLS
ncbi:hypothetical protein [Acidithiobacillus sp.]|jgi:hypothetical protein|uniref:hypothetical protein n=1 Tax=Acidithiobacillus sp. TaxID=1872118 RepID=UPI0026143A4E|nr:hypothetical protein [Acidithiobacillus sp.]